MYFLHPNASIRLNFTHNLIRIVSTSPKRIFTFAKRKGFSADQLCILKHPLNLNEMKNYRLVLYIYQPDNNQLITYLKPYKMFVRCNLLVCLLFYL